MKTYKTAAFVMSCFVHRVASLSNSKSMTMKAHQEAIVDKNHSRRAVVVGGGPAGLAAAITLASEPHAYKVTVIETFPEDATRTYDASKAYLYNLNPRGQKFTRSERFSRIQELVDEKSVSQIGFQFKSFTLIPGDTESKLEPLVRELGTKDVTTKKTYWIPRHEMINVLQDAIRESDCASKIDMKYSNMFESLEPNSKGCLTLTYTETSSKRKHHIEADLIIGADGVNSSVREFFSNKNEVFKNWDINHDEFKAIRKHSPSVGLRVKVNY